MNSAGQEAPKIAVVDLRLHYPPQGGACVDIFNVFTRLGENFDIKLFGVSTDSPYPRGVIKGECPLPFEVVAINGKPSRETIIEGLRSAVERWKPELVYIADGWTLKPYVAASLEGKYPTIIRLYSYEGLCPRTNERWLYRQGEIGHTCGNTCLEDEGMCLACADEYRNLVRVAKHGGDNPLVEEAEIADIWRGDYEYTLRNSLSNAADVICYNQWTSRLLARQLGRPGVVIPGGVDTAVFAPTSIHTSNDGGGKHFKILVPGRMDAASKGAEIAIAAGQILAMAGFDFTMIITRPPRHPQPPSWLNEIGFQPHSELPRLIAEADCVLVPSLWEEAFGMAWVEAMAMGKPVIAAAVAGPLDWIDDGFNGLLFPPGDATKLVEKIIDLINDQKLRKLLGDNGRKLAVEQLDWQHAADKTAKLIQTHLKPNSVPLKQ